AHDGTPGSVTSKVLRARPKEASDGCVLTDGTRVVESLDYKSPGVCDGAYPPHADPRFAAGGPVNDDVLKCKLQALALHDYGPMLTPEQFVRLEHIFPKGVC